MRPLVFQGDVRSVLRSRPDRSVQCFVTSPPYWGLRNYGTKGQVWPGVHPPCNTHRWDKSGSCVWCAAWRGELGLEPTPELYVRHMVEVFREVRRVLRTDGTLWLNLGDSYSKKEYPRELKPKTPAGLEFPGLKKKDLVGIPWAVAFALRDDGWYLRSDIIWYKTNASPESVKDRPTKAHEYIFLLTRSERYYYDIDAIREPHKTESIKRGPRPWHDRRCDGVVANKTGLMHCHPLGRNKRTVWMIATKSDKQAHHAVFPEEIPTICIKAGSRPGDVVADPFAGSGTTGVAALKLGRIPWLFELKKKYVTQVIKPRLKAVRLGDKQLLRSASVKRRVAVT